MSTALSCRNDGKSSQTLASYCSCCLTSLDRMWWDVALVCLGLEHHICNRRDRCFPWLPPWHYLFGQDRFISLEKYLPKERSESCLQLTEKRYLEWPWAVSHSLSRPGISTSPHEWFLSWPWLGAVCCVWVPSWVPCTSSDVASTVPSPFQLQLGLLSWRKWDGTRVRKSRTPKKEQLSSSWLNIGWLIVWPLRCQDGWPHSSGLGGGLLCPEQCFLWDHPLAWRRDRPVTSNILTLAEASGFLFSRLGLYWGLQITTILSVLSVIRGCLNQDKKNSSASPVMSSEHTGPFQSWYLPTMPRLSHSSWRILVHSDWKI